MTKTLGIPTRKVDLNLMNAEHLDAFFRVERYLEKHGVVGYLTGSVVENQQRGPTRTYNDIDIVVPHESTPNYQVAVGEMREFQNGRFEVRRTSGSASMYDSTIVENRYQITDLESGVVVDLCFEGWSLDQVLRDWKAIMGKWRINLGKGLTGTLKGDPRSLTYEVPQRQPKANKLEGEIELVPKYLRYVDYMESGIPRRTEKKGYPYTPIEDIIPVDQILLSKDPKK